MFSVDVHSQAAVAAWLSIELIKAGSLLRLTYLWLKQAGAHEMLKAQRKL